MLVNILMFGSNIKYRQIYVKTKTNKTRKAPRVGANSSSVFAFDMHYK